MFRIDALIIHLTSKHTDDMVVNMPIEDRKRIVEENRNAVLVYPGLYKICFVCKKGKISFSYNFDKEDDEHHKCVINNEYHKMMYLTESIREPSIPTPFVRVKELPPIVNASAPPPPIVNASAPRAINIDSEEVNHSLLFDEMDATVDTPQVPIMSSIVSNEVSALRTEIDNMRNELTYIRNELLSIKSQYWGSTDYQQQNEQDKLSLENDVKKLFEEVQRIRDGKPSQPTFAQLNPQKKIDMLIEYNSCLTGDYKYRPGMAISEVAFNFDVSEDTVRAVVLEAKEQSSSKVKAQKKIPQSTRLTTTGKRKLPDAEPALKLETSTLSLKRRLPSEKQENRQMINKGMTLKGERSANARFSDVEIKDIRDSFTKAKKENRELKKMDYCKKMSAKYKVHITTISRIISGTYYNNIAPQSNEQDDEDKQDSEDNEDEEEQDDEEKQDDEEEDEEQDDKKKLLNPLQNESLDSTSYGLPQSPPKTFIEPSDETSVQDL